MQGAGNDRRVEPRAIEGFAVRLVPIDSRSLRRPTLTHDGDDLTGASRIHKHEGFTAEAIEVLLDYTAGQQGRNARVEGVTSAREDLEGGSGGERVSGGDARVVPHHGRALGGLGRTENGQRRERGYRQLHRGTSSNNSYYSTLRIRAAPAG